MKTIYSGEVQLQRWSDTSSGGATITLWLPDGDDLANFKLLTERKGKQAGQILAMVIKTVDVEDEQAIETAGKRSKVGPLCMSAIELCKNKQFQAFTNSSDEYNAKVHLLNVCRAETRKQLDEVDYMAELFRKLMSDYRAWIAQNGE